MEKYTIPVLDEIKQSGIRRFFDLANKVEGTISLSVGEPDFKTPDHIKKEGIKALEEDKTFYTPNAGITELRKEISLYLKRRFNCSYDYDEILVTIGGSEAVDIAFRSILKKGDEVIITDPGYVSYLPNALLTGATPVFYILNQKDEFKIKKDELEKLITPKTKAIILNYPNNPTGATMDIEDLKEISEVCIKHNIFVISDEVYSELTYDHDRATICSLEGMKERSLLINGFSKSYAMTGWRLGYIAGSREVIKQVFKIHQYSVISASTISQYAGIEALRNGDEDIEMMKKQYVIRREYVYNRLKNMGLDSFFPHGAFYVFVNIKKYNKTSEEFALDLLNKAKVVIVPGSSFGEHGEGYLRLSYAYSLEKLKEGLDRLEKYINSLI